MTSTDGPRPQRPASPGSRRSRNATPRPHRIKFFVDDQEQATITAAAHRAGMSVGTYTATAVLAHATTGTRPTLAERAEFLSRFVGATAARDEARRVLRTVGGLLNQVAATGNATGALPPWTGHVLERVAHAVRRVKVTGEELRTLTREYTTRRR